MILPGRLRRPHGERGSALLFFIVVVLPILFLGLALSIDISRLYSERSRQQAIIDQAAQIGARHLPSQFTARQQALAYLTEQQVDLKNTQVTATADQVSVTLASKEFRPLFLANGSAPSTSGGVHYAVHSTASFNPRNVDIFLDASSYLAPSLDELEESDQSEKLRTSNSDHQPWWGGAYWPTSPTATKLLLPSDFTPRLATKQCFNPALLAVKEAALRMYDFLNISQNNLVGVITGPSTSKSENKILSIRDLLPGRTASPAVFDFSTDLNQLSDIYCHAIAHYDPPCHAHKGCYNIPKPPSWLSQSTELPFVNLVSLRDNPGSSRLTIQQKSPEILALITTRDAIWSRAAKRSDAGSTSLNTVDFRSILSTMSERLLAAPLRPERNKLRYNATNTALILLGDLPHIFLSGRWERFGRNESGSDEHDIELTQSLGATFRAIDRLAARQKQSLTIVVTVLKHRGNYPEPECPSPGDDGLLKPCPRFFEEAQKLETYFKDMNKQLNNLQMYLIRIPDFSSQALEFPALFSLSDRSLLQK